MSENKMLLEPLSGAADLLSSALLDFMDNGQVKGRVFDSAPKVLIACMPKSGSTWFTSLMERGLGMPSMRCYFQPDRNEQEIDTLALFQSLGKEVIFVQQHVRASETMLRLCNSFSVKIIYLTRHIDDAIVSFRDHLENESTIAPMFYMEPEWFSSMPKMQQMDFLIDHCIPWYLNFTVGWVRARQSAPEMILPIQYEKLVSDPSCIFNEVSRFLGRPCRIDAALLERRNGTRFNKGRVGRGKEELSESQQQRIRALAAYYNHVDLSPIGIHR